MRKRRNRSFSSFPAIAYGGVEVEVKEIGGKPSIVDRIYALNLRSEKPFFVLVLKGGAKGDVCPPPWTQPDIIETAEDGTRIILDLLDLESYPVFFVDFLQVQCLCIVS